MTLYLLFLSTCMLPKSLATLTQSSAYSRNYRNFFHHQHSSIPPKKEASFVLKTTQIRSDASRKRLSIVGSHHFCRILHSIHWLRSPPLLCRSNSRCCNCTRKLFIFITYNL
ncbi:unnamed protein product [Trichobilharzia szidati]|nr:unnamed protein product [Trichobilharzia szidati]